MGGDGGGPDAGVPSGLPLSETDGMPSLSGMSPADAAAFLQNNKRASTNSIVKWLSYGLLHVCVEHAIWPPLE